MDDLRWLQLASEVGCFVQPFFELSETASEEAALNRLWPALVDRC